MLLLVMQRCMGVYMLPRIERLELCVVLLCIQPLILLLLVLLILVLVLVLLLVVLLLLLLLRSLAQVAL
jgi:hypothetical protein